jgi:putative transposase
MRTRNYTLSDAEVGQLEQLIRDDQRVKVVQRATAVRMLHLGQSSTTVSQLLLVSSVSVRTWFERFRAEGVAGLVNRPRSGRPRQATQAYWQVVEEALAGDPHELGYPFTIWTLDRLRDHAERRTGKRLTSAYLSEQMKARGYVYRRPKHDLRIHQDAAARTEAEKQLEALKKTPNAGNLSSSLWTKAP